MIRSIIERMARSDGLPILAGSMRAALASQAFPCSSTPAGPAVSCRTTDRDGPRDAVHGGLLGVAIEVALEILVGERADELVRGGRPRRLGLPIAGADEEGEQQQHSGTATNHAGIISEGVTIAESRA